MTRKPRTFQVGDKVAYRADFLRSTGQHTGDTPFLRGEVISAKPFAQYQLCLIRWTLDGKPYPINSQYYDDGLGRVISANLTLVSRIGIDSALAT